MRFKSLWAITMMGGWFVGAASATTLQSMSVEQIAAQAPIAVLAKVTAMPLASTDGSFRMATVKVDQVLWGAPQGEIQVALPGGSTRVGKLSITKVMPGAPQLFTGSQVMLFLEPSQSGKGFAVVGFNQGLLNVLPSGQVVLPGVGAVPVSTAMQKMRELRQQAAGPARPATLQSR